MAKVRAGSTIASWMFGIAFCALVLGYFAFLRSGSTESPSWVSATIFGVLLAAWIFALMLHRSAVCAECGRRYIQERLFKNHPVCPRCRLHRMDPAAHRRRMRKGLGAFLAALLIIGLILGMLIVVALLALGWELRLALMISTALAVLVIPASFLVLLLLLKRLSKSLQTEEGIVARARKKAREEGETFRLGERLVWYSGDVDPAPRMEAQRESSRSRLEALLGEVPDVDQPRPIVVFHRRKDFDGFVRPFLLHTWNFGWIQFHGGTIAISTEDVPSHVVDVEANLRLGFCEEFLDQLRFPPQLHWMRVGVAQFVARPEEAEARRIHRKMSAAIARGEALGVELFALKPERLSHLVRQWYEPERFREYAQTLFQSTSMFRFLIEADASAERLAALRGFLSDLKGEGAVEDLFAARFGFNYEGFLKRWKDAIESEGPGPHDPAPGPAAEKIRNVVGPFIKDSQRPLMGRVVAIRDLGMGGYVEGAAVLIELLRARGDVPEAEVVWALEAISGRTLGADPEAWTAWSRDRCMISEAPA